MQKIRWFFLVLLILVVITLAVQNNSATEIKFAWYSQQFPLSVLLMISAGSGFLLGAIMTASMLRRQRKKKPKQEKAKQASQAKPSEPAGPAKSASGETNPPAENPRSSETGSSDDPTTQSS